MRRYLLSKPFLCGRNKGLNVSEEGYKTEAGTDGWYLSSDGLYVLSGDAFKGGVFLSVVNEGLHILFQVELFFRQHV